LWTDRDGRRKYIFPGLFVGMGVVQWDGTVDLNFVRCSIVSNFTSINRNFQTLNTIIMCSQHSKYLTRRLNAVAKWRETMRQLKIFTSDPPNEKFLSVLAAVLQWLGIRHANGVMYFV